MQMLIIIDSGKLSVVKCQYFIPCH